MMKTILVIYTNVTVSLKEQAKYKRYSFNTENDVKEGDLIDSPEYSTCMQVVKVLNKSFKYFNRSNGELSDEFTSTHQWEIRKLVLREDDDTVVYGKIIKNDK